MRGIFFSPKEEISAMYLAPAFYYKTFVTFGHVNTNADDVYKTLKRFNLHSGHKSLLMFNEDAQSPVASLSVGIFYVTFIIYCSVIFKIKIVYVCFTAMLHKNVTAIVAVDSYAFELTSLYQNKGYTVSSMHQIWIIDNTGLIISSLFFVQMQQISRSTIDEVIEANKFLLLPRISSQSYFEELCPAEVKAKRKK